MNHERTNVYEGQFSPSGITDAKCYRLFYLRRLLKLKPKGSPVALAYGISIHAAVEKYYKLRDEGALSFDEIKAEAVKEFVRTWAEQGLVGDIKRNLEGGILTISRYCDRYRHELSTILKDDVEGAQWVPMPNGTMMLCKLDRLEEGATGALVIDTKTTSMALTDYYFRQYENHLPTTLYAYAVEQTYGHVEGIQIDCIKVPFPPPGSKTEGFSRQTFLRTELQVQDAVRTWCAVTDYIMRGVKEVPKDEWPEYFYCNQNHCNDYGGCPYLGVCRYGLDHPSVKIDFEIEGEE